VQHLGLVVGSPAEEVPVVELDEATRVAGTVPLTNSPKGVAHQRYLAAILTGFRAEKRESFQH
jgi:hypothetical protein